MAGLDKFGAKVKRYKNPALVGVTTGEIASVEPITIEVLYDGVKLRFTKFKSLIDMSGLTEEDVGKAVCVMFTSDNQSVFVLGGINTYNDFYIRTGEG